MANTLPEMHSRIYLAVIKYSVDFSGFKKRYYMIPFGLEQTQLTICDMAAERTTSEWVCERCNIDFQVRYLQEYGTSTGFSLNECPNCRVTDDASDRSMDQGVQPYVLRYGKG